MRDKEGCGALVLPAKRFNEVVNRLFLNFGDGDSRFCQESEVRAGMVAVGNDRVGGKVALMPQIIREIFKGIGGQRLYLLNY